MSPAGSASPADLQALLASGLVDQAQALAKGRTTSLQLTDAQLQAIDASRLNAYLHVDAAGAIQAARDSDTRRAAGRSLGPLDGIGFAVKDNIDVAGMPTTAGMATRRGRIAAHDAHAVRQLRAAGMVPLGKLNMHEAALGATNNNPHFGRCENPHRAGFTPGGSSGGSAAAVAAHLAALALGTDTMGSVRIPAAYCGVVGLKAGPGVVSTGGTVACCWALDHVGPIVRQRRDLPVVMAVLASTDPDGADAPVAAAQPAILRPRWIVAEDLQALGVEPAVAEAYANAIAQLRARGDSVTAIAVAGHDFGRARRAGLLMSEADVLVQHAEDWRTQPQNFSPELARMLRWVEGQGAPALAAAQRVTAAARATAARWFGHGDVLLLPTAPQRAFAFGSPVPANQADFTALANMAALPAISLPLPVAPGSLPIGLQAITLPGHENTLMNLPLEGVVAA
jgi:Asp-tRNA(Asn)/Glu-tRNA(Gln) amidotransferase A subunit family amidase